MIALQCNEHDPTQAHTKWKRDYVRKCDTFSIFSAAGNYIQATKCVYVAK